MAWAPRRLETPRLILQPTGEGDDRAGLDTWLQQRVGLPNQWRIVPKALDRVVGLVGFIRWEPDRSCAEIGFGPGRRACDRSLSSAPWPKSSQPTSANQARSKSVPHGPRPHPWLAMKSLILARSSSFN